MPARIVFAHSDTVFLTEATEALRAAGYEVQPCSRSIDGLAAIERQPEIDLLITRALFPAGTLNGIALARMARIKRPHMRILFVALPEAAELAAGLGEFMAMPVPIPELLIKVAALLDPAAASNGP